MCIQSFSVLLFVLLTFGLNLYVPLWLGCIAYMGITTLFSMGFEWLSVRLSL